ncbi:MAG: type 4a pilus biogenesis protein PilO [bacterium]
MKLRDPAVQKWIVLAGLTIGLIYGYSNYVFLPKKDAIKASTQKLKGERERLEKGKRVAKDFRSIQEDYQQLLATWDAALELLPTEQEMDDLLEKITLAGQSSDVSFLLFRPLEPVEHPYYWENPIQVRTLSTYHRLGEFFSKVAALRRIVNISQLKMTVWSSREERSPNTLEAEFVATIYIFKQPGTPATVKPPESSAKPKAANPPAKRQQKKA